MDSFDQFLEQSRDLGTNLPTFLFLKGTKMTSQLYISKLSRNLDFLQENPQKHNITKLFKSVSHHTGILN